MFFVPVKFYAFLSVSGVRKLDVDPDHKENRKKSSADIYSSVPLALWMLKKQSRNLILPN